MPIESDRTGLAEAIRRRSETSPPVLQMRLTPPKCRRPCRVAPFSRPIRSGADQFKTIGCLRFHGKASTVPEMCRTRDCHSCWLTSANSPVKLWKRLHSAPCLSVRSRAWGEAGDRLGAERSGSCGSRGSQAEVTDGGELQADLDEAALQ